MLIAQIGQGRYQMTNHVHVKEAAMGGGYSEPVYKAEYLFEAVYQQLCRDVNICTQGTEKDTILLAGTKNSFRGSLCVYFLPKIRFE